MLLLIIFAFIAGVVTILSPCILPILPIVLSGSLGGGKRRPLGIVTGFILSFTFFTLFLTALVKATGIPADSLRTLSVVVIFAFGLSLLIPRVQVWIEKLFTKVSGVVSKRQQSDKAGFGGGVLLGISLGLVWTPCVGPILASVISLALTGSVGGGAVIITLAYAFGTSIPLLAITYGGRELLAKVPWLLANTTKIQKTFGVLMIITAIGIHFNVDRKFQTYILDKFPQYGVGLTKLEDNEMVRKQLEKLREKPTKRGDAPEFIPGGEWFNSEPLTLEELRGKVVLVDFWTYTCINCIRTFPYLKDWHAKYKDEGLVIVGVHTPEFEFEKSPKNVEEAIADFGLEHPIVQDNDYATWRAYDNRFWPAKYLIDKNGVVRYTHFGEGKYAETEQEIQKLLEETGKNIDEEVDERVDQAPRGRIQTPELYLGATRMRNRSPVKPPKQNHFYLSSDWEIEDEYSSSSQGSVLELNFTANKVYLVTTPVSISDVVRVYLDGKLVDESVAGEDVIGGQIKFTNQEIYNLIDLKGERGNHILRLEFETSGTRIFAFTFG